MLANQRRADAHGELAAHELDDAVELRMSERYAPLQLLSRAVEDAVPDAGPPARDGRAMNSVEGSDAIDAQAVEVMELEEERVAIWQRGERRLQRLLVSTTVADLQVVQFGVDRDRRSAFRVHGRESAPLLTMDAQSSAN